MDPAWLIFAAPRLSVQRPQNPLKEVFWDLWTENWGTPKTRKSTATDPTPHPPPSESKFLNKHEGVVRYHRYKYRAIWEVSPLGLLGEGQRRSGIKRQNLTRLETPDTKKGHPPTRRSQPPGWPTLCDCVSGTLNSGLQKGPAERGHVKKRQKSAKSVKNFFDTFRPFSRRAKSVKNRPKASKSFSTIFRQFSRGTIFPAPFGGL